jgi:hypothetical protein
MMYIKYDFLNVSYFVIVVAGTAHYSIDIFAELFRHDIHKNMFGANINVHYSRPYLVDDICW